MVQDIARNELAKSIQVYDQDDCKANVNNKIRSW